MPLRDHFQNDADETEWDGVNASWPTYMADAVNAKLPPNYVARSRIHIGTTLEIDMPTFEKTNWEPAGTDAGGVATRPLAAPTLLLEGDAPTPSEYELLVYERPGMKLVSALELVSPSNKDRPDPREQFVGKCVSLLRHGASLAIVDVVSSRRRNLYGELQQELGTRRTPVSTVPLYAMSSRGQRRGRQWRLEAWEHELRTGQPLPVLPVWLNETLFVELDLESTYEAACRSQRIA